MGECWRIGFSGSGPGARFEVAVVVAVGWAGLRFARRALRLLGQPLGREALGRWGSPGGSKPVTCDLWRDTGAQRCAGRRCGITLEHGRSAR
jgi:hypothetical protein